MKEQIYQKRITEQLEEKGYYVINLIKTNKNGIPDLIAIKENCKTIFIECKSLTGVASPLQKFRLKELSLKGFEVYISKGNELIPFDVDFTAPKDETPF